MKVISLIFLAVCMALATANSIFDPRIVGGANAIDGQFPYQASLRIRFINQHFCGASILNKRFLLTAAHCTTGLLSWPIFVVAKIGSVNRSKGGMTVKLNKIYRHEGWGSIKIENDISLIRTAKDITFTDTIQPIALPKPDLPGANVHVIYSGWGRHLMPTQKLPEVLQYAEARTLSRQDCIDRFNDDRISEFVRNNSLCIVNKNGIGACQGDSGGPLVDVSDPEHKTVVGIASWVIPCGRGFPDVFTRVSSYLDWIQAHMDK